MSRGKSESEVEMLKEGHHEGCPRSERSESYGYPPGQLYATGSGVNRTRSFLAHRVDVLAWSGAAFFAVVVVIPLVFSLGYAVLYSVGLAGLLREGFTLAHWSALFSGDLLGSFTWSAYLATTATTLTLVLALLLALVLRVRIESGLLGTLLYLPLSFPATAAALVVFLALSPFGTLARIARAAGLLDVGEGMPNLVHDAFGTGILVAHVGLAFPFFVLLFVQLYQQERVEDLVAVAQSLGSTPRQALWRVTLPVLLRRAAPSLVLLFVVVLGSYEIPLLLDRQSPQMLSVLAMRKFALFDITQKPEAFVVAVAYTAVVLAGLAALFRSGRMDV